MRSGAVCVSHFVCFQRGKLLRLSDRFDRLRVQERREIEGMLQHSTCVFCEFRLSRAECLEAATMTCSPAWECGPVLQKDAPGLRRLRASHCLRKTDRKNERQKERQNQRTKDRKKDRTKERKDQRKKEREREKEKEKDKDKENEKEK